MDLAKRFGNFTTELLQLLKSVPAVTASDLKRMHIFRRTLLESNVARIVIKLLKNRNSYFKKQF